MKKYSSTWVLYGIAVLAVVGLMGFIVMGQAQKADPKMDAFAQCLTEKGVKMFGAWWCPHCKTQKEAFGKSFEKINYTECSAAGTNGMNQICKDAKIEGYPTWEFGDGTRVSGEQALEDLGKKAECAL